MKEWLTPHPKSDIHEVLIWKDGMVWLPEHAEGGLRNYLLGFNPKTEKWDHSIDEDPTDVVRNPIKWTQSQAFDSKGNLYTTETYRGQRVQKFTYKGIGAVAAPNEGAPWPANKK